MRYGTHAVIPVKAFALAKRRLAPMLDVVERTRLARLMLEDVLDAVNAAGSLSGFFVVTAHREAGRMAEMAGGAVIWEAGEFGFAHAVATAQRQLVERRAGMMVIPSDIPHLPSATIDAVNAATPERGIAILPATSDGGTNLLSIRPCDLIPPLFGPRSFERHRARAIRAGAPVEICHCPLASHDLDRPGDLPGFLALNTPSRARDYIGGLDIADRLAALRCDPAAQQAAACA